MKKSKISFWRIFWPSLVAGIVLIIIGFIFISGFIGVLMQPKQSAPISKNTVLHLRLDKIINETSKRDLEFGLNGIGLAQKTGLADLLYGFEKAKTDNNIKGVFIELDGASSGYSTATTLRNAIKDFEEESGKFVVAYHKGEFISLKQYFIASAASENYGFHSSNFEFLGLGAELMFFKGLFDKLDIEMQVIRGPNNDFKSAVEPYFLTEMSDSSKLQVERYLNNIWLDIKTQIGKDRDLTIQELDDLANNGTIKTVTQAVENNLLDGTKYRDEVLDLISVKAGLASSDDLKLMSFEKYAEKKFYSQQAISNVQKANVAVIVAEGDITVNGDGIASNNITKLFRDARKDKDIKTIVFRINSPGGSALASDEIWREVTLASEEKKVIVSMGDVAASGGYYIAAPADKIFAQNSTITGSIGVFGVIPYTGALLENKLGISFDRVGTNKYASSLTTNKKLTPDELELVQSEVNSIYNDFVLRVAEGRNMTIEQVNAVARGRVWTGSDAVNIGLVDTIGGINDAINYAVKEAGIENPIIRYYPKIVKDELVQLIEALEESQSSDKKVNSSFVPEDVLELYKQIRKIEDMTGIQARIPYEILW
ncbi:MAG: signal peptide peptidase SppA [Brumimicrobium sp.]